MAVTDLSVTELPFQQSVTYSGTAAETDGVQFVNDGQTIIIVQNGSGQDCDVTITAVADEAGRDEDYVVTLSNGDIEIFGPFRPGWWNQRSGNNIGYLLMDFEVETSVTVMAIKLNL